MRTENLQPTVVGDILQLSIQKLMLKDLVMTVSATADASPARRIDENALRFNQVMIVGLVVLAFITDQRWLVLLTGVCMAIGAAWPGRGPFQLLYRKVLIPSGVISPRAEPGDPRPHRFAQIVGASCLIAAGLLLNRWDLAGWFLAWVVVALALVNLLFGFCTGCFLYLQLSRIGLAGGAR